MNNDQLNDNLVRSRTGSRASVISLIVNLLLFGGKAAVGLLSGAISITADAFNNLSDAATQVISIVSFRLSSKPADREHPFGHARIEYVASMIVSFLVLLVGIELFSDSVSKLIQPAPPSKDNAALALCVLSAAVLAKVGLGIFNLKTARRIGSSVLRATAADCFSDAVSTTAVAVGMVVFMATDLVRVDAAMGLAVSLLILWSGIKIFNDTKNSILGERPSEDIVAGIRAIVEQYPEALGIHDMVVHNYGPGRAFASLHVEVDGKGDFFALHDTVDNIEKRIAHELNINTTIHMDPIVTDDELVNSLREQVAAAVASIDPRLKIHDLRHVAGQSHTNIIFDIVAPFDLPMSDAELTAAADGRVKAIDPTYNTVITVDRE